MLTDVNNYYCHLLHKFQGNTLEVTSTVQKLEEKLKKYYGEKICIVRGDKRKDNILYGSSLSLEEVVQRVDTKDDDMKTKVRDIALILIEEISRAERFSLPNNLKIEDIKRGELGVPELVATFFQNLIFKPDVRRCESNFKKIRIKSMSEDAVFAATAGLKKPQKHLMLGIASQSLTGSKKVIEIMNRLGHCASYHTIEEIQTEATFESAKRKLVTPLGMKLNPRCGTDVGWDNFDRFVETITGKETLHDTVGITYQTITEEEPIDQEPGNDENLSSEEENCFTREVTEAIHETLHKKKKHRPYESRSLDIIPYRKKLKLRTSDFLSNDNPKRINLKTLPY